MGIELADPEGQGAMPNNRSIRALYAVAKMGRLADVDWFLSKCNSIWNVQLRPPLRLRLYERVQLTEHVVQGGIPAMQVARSRRNSESLLIWSDTMLAYAVRCHGTSPNNGDWWPLALEMCGGWTPKALQAAVRYACPDVILSVARHPEAAPTLDMSSFWAVLMDTATYQTNPDVFNLLMRPPFHPAVFIVTNEHGRG